MRTIPHHPLGAHVLELRLNDVDTTTVAALRVLLAEHGVLVLPGQHVDDTDFVGFLRKFGPLAFTTGETPVPGFPDLNLVSNVGRVNPPRSTFHVDTSYVRQPPAYTALRAVRVPANGGETLFTNQYRAFDLLSPAIRTGLQGRTIRHALTEPPPGENTETAAEHPVFRPHPVSGRTALYLSTPRRCTAISGLEAIEAEAIVEFLFEHSTRSDNIFRHRWSPGDVVLWDNGCVLHRADHTQVTGDRVLHRGMVAGYPDRRD